MLHLKEDLEVDGMQHDKCDDVGSTIAKQQEESLAIVGPYCLAFVIDVQLGSGDEEYVTLGQVGMQLLLQNRVQLHYQ